MYSNILSQTLYAAAYHDDYSFIGQHGVPSTLTATTVSGFPIDATIGHGLQTGSATAILGNDSVTGYTYSAMYYDSRYRVAQVRATDHTGGTCTTCTAYSYTGRPVNVKAMRTKSGTGTTTVDNAYTYDGADRAASHTFSVTHGVPPATAVFNYTYDALGRLTGTSRPTSVGNVAYTYDLHGWLTGITTGSFSEELFYAGGPGTPRWNGSISAVRWRSDEYYPKRGYKFTYDTAGRMTQAMYGEGDNITGSGRFRENVQYDAHGNVTAVTRYGKTSSNGYGVMDNLTMTYDGNRLTGVSETASDYDAYGSFEYKRKNGSEYIYNANGSLVADRSRGIAYITYDLNGNPQAIYFMNGNEIRYTYSAAGEKLRVRYYVAVPNVTREFGVKPSGSTDGQVMCVTHSDYLLGGMLTMKNNLPDMVLFDGGYAKATRLGDTTYGFTLNYYNRDHLGNVREVVNANSGVLQVTNYYPFGAPYADPAAAVDASLQPYKYNGKELETMHGLNTYDYGARQYNPIVGRWDRMDPLCEKYYDISPYAYCHGDPLNFIDPDGRDLILHGDSTNISNSLEQIQNGAGEGISIYYSDADSNLKYQISDGYDTSLLSEQAKLLIKIIDNHNIIVNINAISRNELGDGRWFVAGGFLGNEVMDNGTIIANQVINPRQLAIMDEAGSPGQNIFHEISESYNGAELRLQGVDSSNLYNAAHKTAMPQTELKGGFFNFTGNYSDTFIPISNSYKYFVQTQQGIKVLYNIDLLIKKY